LIFFVGAGLVPSRKPTSCAPQRIASTYAFQRVWFPRTSFSEMGIRVMVAAVDVASAMVIESGTLDEIEETSALVTM
jgi:hypothetical protein